jgi:predicted transcriptional regulator
MDPQDSIKVTIDNGYAFEVTMDLVTVCIYDAKACGESARRERKKRGLTLKQVAEAMGCSLRYVSVIERGEKKWTKELVDRYSQALMATQVDS